MKTFQSRNAVSPVLQSVCLFPIIKMGCWHSYSYSYSCLYPYSFILIFILTGRRVHQEAADRARMREGLRRRRRANFSPFGKGSSWTEYQPDTERETGNDLKRQEVGGEGREGGGTFPLTIRQSPLRNMKEHPLLYPPLPLSHLNL